MNEENLDKIFMEGYSDGYTQCLVNIEGVLKSYGMIEENVLQRIIKKLEKARNEYLDANK